MKAIKITNPIWLGHIAPRIKDFIDRIVKMKGYTYESLYTYLGQTIQFGGNRSELWVVFNKKDQPVAFANWYVKALPWQGVVQMDTIYKWGGGKEPVRLLVDEYIKFGFKHKCPVFVAGSYNKAIIRHMGTEAKKIGYSCEDTGCQTMIMEKENA